MSGCKGEKGRISDTGEQGAMGSDSKGGSFSLHDRSLQRSRLHYARHRAVYTHCKRRYMLWRACWIKRQAKEKAWRGKKRQTNQVTWPRSHSREVAEPGMVSSLSLNSSPGLLLLHLLWEDCPAHHSSNGQLWASCRHPPKVHPFIQTKPELCPCLSLSHI